MTRLIVIGRRAARLGISAFALSLIVFGAVPSLAGGPVPTPPEAGDLFAVDGAGGVPSSLYRIDLQTGEVAETIGAVGFDGVAAIAFHPITRRLYGLVVAVAQPLAEGEGGEGPATRGIIVEQLASLIEIDVATGRGTFIALVPGRYPTMTFANDGRLFGWSEFPVEPKGAFDQLVEIDIETGDVTVVGCEDTLGPLAGLGGACSTSGTGLEFLPDGRLYLKTEQDLFVIDRDTAFAEFVTSLSGPTSNVLAAHPDGSVYSARRPGGGGPRLAGIPLGSEIYRLPIATGELTLVGTPDLPALSSLAFFPPETPPVLPGHLYAVDGASGNEASLHRLDSRSGAVIQTYGPTGVADLSGLAVHPVIRELFAIATPSVVPGGIGGPPTSELYQLDPTTGAATFLVPVVGAYSDLAFSAEGQLYGWRVDPVEPGPFIAGVPPLGTLVQIDIATGETVSPGPCLVFGEEPCFAPDGGLAFGLDGALFMTSGGQFFEVSRETGGASFLGDAPALGFGSNMLTGGINGLLYVAQRPQLMLAGELPPGTAVFTIDAGTGELTLLGGNELDELSAIDMVPETPLYLVAETQQGPFGEAPGFGDRLLRVSPSTGELLQDVGGLERFGVTGLAFHPETGALYTMSEPLLMMRGVLNTSSLSTHDPVTGLPTGGVFVSGLYADLAFSPDGRLFGWATGDLALKGPLDSLVEIDPETGDAASVGPCFDGKSACDFDGAGLTFTLDGRLLLQEGSRLHEVDTETGALTFLADMPFITFGPGMFTTAPDGKPYIGVRNDVVLAERGFGLIGDTLGIIDLADYTALAVGFQLPQLGTAMAFPVPVPEPSGLALQGGVLAVLVALRRRRRGR